MGRVVDRKDIGGVVRHLRDKGARIVFTNGCFDLLHAGHVRYLGEAKRFGGALIVGVNSDRSVSRIKPGRPINPAHERAEVLAALAAVDYVVLFDEDTPWNLIHEIEPDVLVKGGDWKREEIVGSDIVADVHSLPYHQGLSTTELIRKIRASGD